MKRFMESLIFIRMFNYGEIANYLVIVLSTYITTYSRYSCRSEKYLDEICSDLNIFQQSSPS